MAFSKSARESLAEGDGIGDIESELVLKDEFVLTDEDGEKQYQVWYAREMKCSNEFLF